MKDKCISFPNREVKVREFYGYNDHYYVTIYDNRNGSYIGELTDCRVSDNNLIDRVKQLLGIS